MTYSCSGHFPGLTADDYQKYLNETLAEIHKNIPKVFVNLVLMGNISEVSTCNCRIVVIQELWNMHELWDIG